jgi:hypothetical protein
MMLTEFDQTTIANMTTTLDFFCKKIPAVEDSKRTQAYWGWSARIDRSSLIDLQRARMKISEEARSRREPVGLMVAR